MKSQAQPIIEAVPTPAQVLREAIAHREQAGHQAEEQSRRLGIFQPIEAEVSAAQAELNAITQADAQAMQQWVDAGAQGNAPDANNKARDAAAIKLSAAHAKLTATGAARSQIQAAVDQAQHAFNAASQAVKDAEDDIILHEWMRTAHTMKAAAVAYLTEEQHYWAARKLAYEHDKMKANQLQASVGEVAKPLTVVEEQALYAELAEARTIRIAALLRGEQPA